MLVTSLLPVQVAVGVLAALLAVVVAAGVVLYVMKRKRRLPGGEQKDGSKDRHDR